MTESGRISCGQVQILSTQVTSWWVGGTYIELGTKAVGAFLIWILLTCRCWGNGGRNSAQTLAGVGLMW